MVCDISSAGSHAWPRCLRTACYNTSVIALAHQDDFALQGHRFSKLTEHLYAQAEVEVRGLESGASQDVTGQVNEACMAPSFFVVQTTFVKTPSSHMALAS